MGKLRCGDRRLRSTGALYEQGTLKTLARVSPWIKEPASRPVVENLERQLAQPTTARLFVSQSGQLALRKFLGAYRPNS
jgi:hypothetical protein